MADGEYEIGSIALKRRKKAAGPLPSIRIADDDEDEKKVYRKKKRREVGHDEGGPVVLGESHRARDFHASHPPPSESQNGLSTPANAPSVPRKRGGLRTAAEVAAEAAEERRKEQEEYKREEDERLARLREGAGETGSATLADPSKETVYRDSSGRRIDLGEEAALARRAAEDEKRLAREKALWNRGQVQEKEKAAAREELEKIKTTGFARHSTDLRMNDGLKDKMLWNDPAASFLSKTKAKTSSVPQYPQYKGPPPPTNRFGILPGYRWDGVDRGNGFEKKLFDMRHSRKLRQTGAYAASTDDM